MKTGLLLIDKPQEWTSYDIIRFLKPKFKPGKIGHAGTLDPLATGLLPVAVGNSTKLIPFIHLLNKEYVAEARLGITSDTYDITGRVEQVPEILIPRQDEVEACLRGFLGETMQVPPLYSALKINGRPAYRYARGGQNIELAPRPIRIDRIDLLEYTYPRVYVRIRCSSGTYIRSLIHDMGRSLHSGAVMTSLIRTAIGPFQLEQSISPTRQLTPDQWRERLIPPRQIIGFLPELVLRDDFPLENGLPIQPVDILHLPDHSDPPYAIVLKKKSSTTILAIVKAEKIDYIDVLQWKYCCIINYDSET
ncbi:MAG: tRNA pseudouridine(55) synthase TruB [Candidatus Delongbacteria bacterium]|nr:tRNA pseudouridine(55) synthase TruB [Candidatus Delongbacteria bacterium]